MTLLLVAAGAALGAPLRYVAAHLLDGRLHWGTILVNLVGSFLLGAFSGAGLDGNTLAFLGTGFCGALTTYSAFAVHVHDLGPRRGAATVLLTAVPALALAFLGLWLSAG